MICEFKKLNRYAALAVSLVAFLQAPPGTIAPEPPLHPSWKPLDKNVVLFFLDDPIIDAMKMYSRIHLYQRKIDGTYDPGGTDPVASKFYADLPTLDMMAESGVMFSEFRAMPYCSPSRACLLSGMYPFKRHGQGNLVKPNLAWDDEFELSAQQGFTYPLITDFIHAANKKASMIGKWHLSQRLNELATPPLNGFTGSGWDHIPRVGKWDSFVATFANLNRQPIPDKNGQTALGVQGTYYHYFRYNNNSLEEVTNQENESSQAPSNRDNLDRTGYLTRSQAIDISRAINSHSREERFFIYASFNTVHMPLQAPPVDMVRTAAFKTNNWPGKRFNNIQGMMESMDHSINYVLSNMSADARENTVFMVAGDNGTGAGAFKNFDEFISLNSGSTGRLGDSYGYLLGAREYNLPPGASPALGPQKNRTRLKSTAFERGIRAPLIIWDPSGDVVINPGRESLAMVDIVDLMPTILDIMGVAYEAKDLDGKSLLPVLRNDVSRQTHARQFSFSEVYAPTGTGPTANPRNDPNFIGEWSPSLGVIPAGKIVSYHNDTVRFYKATTNTGGNPHYGPSTNWQALAVRQRSFIMDLRDVPSPGTYKILRNYFEDSNEFVDHLHKLYDSQFNHIDPIEAYDLDQVVTYAMEYHIISGAFRRFLDAAPPSAPIF